MRQESPPGNRQSAAQPSSSAMQRVESGAIKADQFRLRYRIEGNGIPALVIGSSIYYPRVFSQELRQRLRMVFLDHRAFAPVASAGDFPVSGLMDILDDVERARQQLALNSVVVIGHSGHALMALEYAKKYPRHVSHVVMIGIVPNLGPENMAAANQYWRESVDPERKALQAENLRQWPDERPDQAFIPWYIHNGPKIWFDPRFDATPLWEGVEFDMAIFNRVWGSEFRDIDITKGLETFDRPVFLALGRYDFIAAPPASWDPIRPKFRDLTVRVFERSGHTPQFEEPELFDRELLHWLQSTPTNQAAGASV